MTNSDADPSKPFAMETCSVTIMSSINHPAVLCPTSSKTMASIAPNRSHQQLPNPRRFRLCIRVMGSLSKHSQTSLNNHCAASTASFSDLPTHSHTPAKLSPCSNVSASHSSSLPMVGASVKEIELRSSVACSPLKFPHQCLFKAILHLPT